MGNNCVHIFRLLTFDPREEPGALAAHASVCAGGAGYGRIVAACSVNGNDLGDWLVRNGWAVA